jgi:hypothetical protein
MLTACEVLRNPLFPCDANTLQQMARVGRRTAQADNVIRRAFEGAKNAIPIGTNSEAITAIPTTNEKPIPQAP